jgi:hypothetical protein
MASLHRGSPGSGKRVLLLNQILRMKERPARTVVIHLDKTTREYEKVADEIHTDFTALGDGEQRTLLIPDELPWANLSKEHRGALFSLFSYGSTHKNCSIALLFQVFTTIPAPFEGCVARSRHFQGATVKNSRTWPHLWV